jgi:hypothetical protein
MRNLTLAVDDDVLDKARVIAAQRKTTVNAMVRDFLVEIATRDEKREETRKRLLELVDNSEGRMAPDWKFDREGTYER